MITPRTHDLVISAPSSSITLMTSHTVSLRSHTHTKEKSFSQRFTFAVSAEVLAKRLGSKELREKELEAAQSAWATLQIL